MKITDIWTTKSERILLAERKKLSINLSDIR